MKTRPIAFSLFLLIAGSLQAAEERVHCEVGHELKAALAGVTSGTTLHVSGTCYGPINIKNNDLLLIGSSGEFNAVLKNSPFLSTLENVVNINDATGVWISGFDIKNGLTAITATNQASFTLDNIAFIKNVEDLSLNDAAVQLSNIDSRNNNTQN